MHAAFLMDRRMQVKVGNAMSPPIPVTGGAVQGSLLGVLDHNAVLESMDDDFFQQANKYVDDMTLDERTDKSAPAVVDFDDTQGKERYTFRAIKTQRTLQKLDDKCEIKGFCLNEKKTQLLSISTGRAATRSWVTTNDGGTIYLSLIHI